MSMSPTPGNLWTASLACGRAESCQICAAFVWRVATTRGDPGYRRGILRLLHASWVSPNWASQPSRQVPATLGLNVFASHFCQEFLATTPEVSACCSCVERTQPMHVLVEIILPSRATPLASNTSLVFREISRRVFNPVLPLEPCACLREVQGARLRWLHACVCTMQPRWNLVHLLHLSGREDAGGGPEASGAGDQPDHNSRVVEPGPGGFPGSATASSGRD